MPVAASVQHPHLYRLVSFGHGSIVEEEYHAIRKAELFNARGRSGVYRKDHPDERKPDNFPLALLFDGRTVGVCRLDRLQSPVIDTAAVRMVAVDRSQQGRGYGRNLMLRLEWFAFTKGVSLLVVNAAKNAAEFYSKLGYSPSAWKDPGTGLGDEIFQMAKLIKPSEIIDPR